ncbi:MAG: DUF4136 domain-containing protein [Nitrospinae bacterium]|nr:DUF4136 domain-containing protein [Nitrospinota bacterium]
MEPRLLKRMALASRFRFWWAALPLLVMAGCAYEVSLVQGVARPGKIRSLERVAVAPFRYPSDWTGLFRHVYAQAGLKAPDVRKIEMVEGAFLIRDAITAKGYLVHRWPKELEKIKADDLWNAEGGIAEAHLAALRRSGAQAVMIAGGGRTCEDVEVCVARVEIRLVDLNSRETLWQSQAMATTALSQGDEMKAAVSEAFAAFPGKSPASN